MVFDNVVIDGTKVQVKNQSLESGYREFREAIMDGKIPVYMPIGFSLNTPKNVSPTSAIDRNVCCQESMVAIATNVSNLIFIGNISNKITCQEMDGEITTGNASWRSGGKHECKPINPNQHLLTAIAPMSIEFIMNKGTGYHSMAENSKIIGKTICFPLNTSHTLIEYVRVLPLMKNYIEIQYINGMTPETLTQIFKEAVG